MLTPTFIFIGTALFCCGGVVGFLVSRKISASVSNRQLEQKLQDKSTELESANAELKNYRNNVTGHFTETARLIDTLNQSYKQVHDHLTQGVNELIPEDTRKEILSSASIIHIETATHTTSPTEVHTDTTGVAKEVDQNKNDKQDEIENVEVINDEVTSNHATSSNTTELANSEGVPLNNSDSDEKIVNPEKEQHNTPEEEAPKPINTAP